MQSALHLRLADLDDASFLASFGRQTFESAFGPLNDPADIQNYLAKAFSLDTISKEIAQPGDYFFLAYQEKEVVGYSKIQASAHPNLTLQTPTTELQRIYIASEKLGMGLGKTLLFLTLAEAIKIGNQSTWLGVWEENTAALRFYLRWGFEKRSSHSFALGKDLQRDLLLARALPQNISDLAKEFDSEI